MTFGSSITFPVNSLKCALKNLLKGGLILSEWALGLTLGAQELKTLTEHQALLGNTGIVSNTEN